MPKRDNLTKEQKKALRIVAKNSRKLEKILHRKANDLKKLFNKVNNRGNN